MLRTLMTITGFPCLSLDIDVTGHACLVFSNSFRATLIIHLSFSQVRRESGEWMPVPYLPGTVVLIVGTLLQRWTSDRLKAAVILTQSLKSPKTNV